MQQFISIPALFTATNIIILLDLLKNILVTSAGIPISKLYSLSYVYIILIIAMTEYKSRIHIDLLCFFRLALPHIFLEVSVKIMHRI